MVLRTYKGHFTDVSKQQHPREYGGAVGWWVVVGVYGQGPQAAMTASRSSLPTMPSPSTSASGSSLLQASRTASRSWTACNVAQRDATEDSEAGEGIRTLNIQLGRLRA